jgi:hypothetical protein
LIHSDFLILFESILTPVKRQNISVTFSSRKYELPSYLRKEVTKRIESIKKHSKVEGFDFFDDKVARLDDWSFTKNYDYGTLRLHFSETSYYYFAAMNLGLDQPVTTLDKNKKYYHDKRNEFTLRHLLGERSYDLKNSKLPNPLSVNMSVLLIPPSSKSGNKSNLKPKIILSKRSKSHNLEAQGTLSCLIGGTISIGEGDIDATGNPDSFKTVVREAKEELSLDLYNEFNDNDIVFFGLGRNMLNLKPELYGEVLISGITEKEVVQAWKNAKDKEESKNLIFEEIHGSRLRTMIKHNSWWSPVGRRATIASLRNRSMV